MVCFCSLGYHEAGTDEFVNDGVVVHFIVDKSGWLCCSHLRYLLMMSGCLPFKKLVLYFNGFFYFFYVFGSFKNRHIT
ncbi:MAG: hypothetical protein K1W13_03950 [Lachnospiraceae bacterium]